MTTFSTKKANSAVLPNVVGGVTTVLHTIDPSTLASYPAAADLIDFFDIPANVRIVDSSVRCSADIGVATSTLQLKAKQGGSTVNLTSTLASTAAGSIRQNVAPPPKYADVTTIQIGVATEALDAAGDIEVMVQYINP